MNNATGADTGGEGLSEDLKRLLARAEADDEGTDVYVEDAEDDEESEDDGELEESFGTVERGESAGEDINGGQLQISEFGHEMRQSFIEYSMSVITARALPDVRDGLKPVHRRILYAMNESGIYPNRPHKKSAWTVGEVIGKYHPHGDSAVYDTMVRLAQWFSMRHPAHRRSRQLRQHRRRRCRGHALHREPSGASGHGAPARPPEGHRRLAAQLRRVARRAAGAAGRASPTCSSMALRVSPWVWPPTSRRTTSPRAVEATCYLIDHPDATVDELMQIMPGPDFPTGAVIMGSDGIRQAYETGRGSITVRAKAHVESTKTGRNRLVFTEIPYQVNKGTLQEKIAQLVNEKRIEGISDMRDESTQKGIRLVIELKKGVIPQVVLNNLYKFTSLQTTFGANNLALVDGVPKVPVAPADAASLHRPPGRRGHPPHPLRPQEGPGSRAHPRGLPHGARPHRRGHQASSVPPRPTARRASGSLRALALRPSRRAPSSRCACAA